MVRANDKKKLHLFSLPSKLYWSADNIQLIFLSLLGCAGMAGDLCASRMPTFFDDNFQTNDCHHIKFSAQSISACSCVKTWSIHGQSIEITISIEFIKK